MGFWWWMFGCALLLPVVMIVVGRLSWKHGPKDINLLMGYRTTRSTKSQATWDFANAYFGHLCEKLGWISLIPSGLLMLPFLHSSENVIGGVNVGIVSVQTLLLLLPILPTERELKKRFDDNGNPKE